jgi:LPS export ABC transporter protein LptC
LRNKPKYSINFPKKKRRFLSPFLRLSALIYFASCENDLEKVKEVTSLDSFPQETAENIEVIYSDSGQVQARMRAPLMEHYVRDKPFIEFTKGVHVEFFDYQMKVESELTANYAISYENEKKMIAKHDVVVINKKGEKLNTELLIWEEREQKIHTPEFVKITTEEEIIFGDGLEANQDFTKYKITNIKGTIQINQNDSTENP